LVEEHAEQCFASSRSPHWVLFHENLPLKSTGKKPPETAFTCESPFVMGAAFHRIPFLYGRRQKHALLNPKPLYALFRGDPPYHE